MIDLKGWSAELPTEPGFYWFYGWLFGKTDAYKKRMEVVEAKQVSNGLVFTAHNAFLDSREMFGIFHPAVPPELPKENNAS